MIKIEDTVPSRGTGGATDKPWIPKPEAKEHVVELSEKTRTEVAAMVDPGGYDRSVRARAQMVLWRYRDGIPVSQVAERAGVSRSTAYTWLDRFDEEGVSGLRDKPRPGRPRTISDRTRARILELSQQVPPESTGLSRWSAVGMSRYLATHEDVHVSANFVVTLWRDHGFRSHRHNHD